MEVVQNLDKSFAKSSNKANVCKKTNLQTNEVWEKAATQLQWVKDAKSIQSNIQRNTLMKC